MKISGTVYDTTGVKPLYNALAMAVRNKDSVMLDFARTDSKGFFVLNFEMDTFTLVIAHPNYDDKLYYFFGNPENLETNIPKITMPERAQQIDEVIIYANKNPIFYRGDTLVYVADSFAVGENAVVEDLLKKLPGIEVDKDGKIKSQGQDIAKVLVDGDEFFGADPTIATKNLAADGIETVQVYEKENEDGEFGSDEKIQVLDLKLKEDAKKGYFGRVSAASDFGATYQDFNQAYYEGELLLNSFRGAQKISVFALGSNTPRSNFGWGDINKFGLDNESSGGNRWDEGNTTNTSGVPQTMRAGIYYSDKFGKKRNGKINFNYSYYNTQLDANSASRSQFFLPDTVYYTDDSTNNLTKNESHQVNINFKTNIDSLTQIGVNGKGTYDLASQTKTDITKYLTSENDLSWRNFVQNSSESVGTSLDGELWIERKFMKPKRELWVSYNVRNNLNETDGNLFSNAAFEFNPLFNDTINQSKLNDNGGVTHEAQARFSEPLGKKWRLETGYQYGTTKSFQERFTYDEQNGSYTVLRQDLSNNFETKRDEHRGGVKLVYAMRKHEIGARVDVRNIDIVNQNFTLNTDINQNVTNVLPIVEYQYKPSMSKRFSVKYRTNSQLPSLNNLQPVPDNTNPNFLKVGNPDLLPNYTHQLNVNFNTWQAMTGRFIWSGIFANIAQNDFADSTAYSPFGVRQSKTVNVDGNYNINLFAGGGFPVYKKIISLRPNINGGIFRNTSFVEATKNVTDNINASGGLNVRFEWDSLEINVGNTYSYVNPINRTGSATVSNPFNTQNYTFDIIWKLPKGFKVQTDLSYNINGQRADGYNINFLLWNAELSKSFLKTENLVLSLVGRDMLNQNINAQRIVTSNIITDNRTQIISRYFLMKLTLRFNNNKTKEEDQHGWH